MSHTFHKAKKGDDAMDSVGFSELIKTSRLKQNLTQKQLAEKINVTDKAVSKWERGECFPDINLFEALSNVLNVPIDELMLQGESEEEKKARHKSKMIKTIALGLWILLGFMVVIIDMLLSVDIRYFIGVYIGRRYKLLLLVAYLVVLFVIARYPIKKSNKKEL